MRWLIYNTGNGRIMANMPNDQIYKGLYNMELDHIGVSNPPKNWTSYRVVKGELVLMNDTEIKEMETYNRILSEEERLERELLSKLNPSHEDIKKAEQTIEILTLIQEVI